MSRYLVILIMLVGIGSTSANATLIGVGDSHLLFNYHGQPVICPRGAALFTMITCIDRKRQAITCHILPAEQGFIDCGHLQERIT